jgi:hypothetical protein
MNKEQVLGIVRHGLTFFGGVLLTKGLVDEQMWSEISGSLITLIGGIWSIVIKSKGTKI